MNKEQNLMGGCFGLWFIGAALLSFTMCIGIAWVVYTLVEWLITK